MKILNFENKNFYIEIDKILKKRSQKNLSRVDTAVKNIINNVINYGDRALFKYAKKFDGSQINKNNIRLSKNVLLSYKKKVDIDTMKAFKVAIRNISNFHKKQKPQNYQVKSKGIKTNLIWKPIESVGLYIPGGTAVYPSSLLMNVIPAKIAGVERIVVVTPSKLDEINPYILAMLDELNIKEVYQIGGAHAIAALTYGTKSIQAVNKIFGPGNQFVASAKKQVFGTVGIDIIAGPSEIIVVADNTNKPEWVASDLIAQAEHDEKSQSILITNNKVFAKKVLFCIKKLITKLPKKSIIKKSLDNYGATIIINNILDAYKIINYIAPEHLHLQNKEHNKILKNIKNAGGLFLGEYSTEAFGDYIVGTNHILPTSGSAKFSSGVGVIDFMKRTSVVDMNLLGFKRYQKNVSQMAQVENLDGHKLSVKIRQIDKK